MAKVDEWLARLIPRRCVLCNQPCGAASFCAGCHEDLPWIANICPTCGGAMAATASGPCWHCGGLTRAPLRVRAPLSYEYPVDRMITAVKFHGQLHFARALGELLAEVVADPRTAADLLVPVPLHRARLIERGFNQALEIARPVAERTGVTLAAALCERKRATAEQSGLPAAGRRRNLRGAFRVRGRCEGARIAIVDDVVTTGSTAAALARALRAAGAAAVEVWAVARTL